MIEMFDEFRPLLIIVSVTVIVGIISSSCLVCAESDWISPGTYVEYCGSGYLNISHNGQSCYVSPKSIRLKWVIEEVKENCISIEFTLEFLPPIKKLGNCSKLNITGSTNLIFRSLLNVNIESRKASFDDFSYGILPLWIEGLVPGARVVVSGKDNQVLYGRVRDIVYHKIGKEKAFFRVFEVEVGQDEIPEALYIYDSNSGLFLELFYGEIDENTWPFLKSLVNESITIGRLWLNQTNIELSKASDLTNIVLSGHYIRFVSMILAVSSIAGLIWMEISFGGFKRVIRTRSGTLLLALLVLSFILLILTAPFGLSTDLD